MAGVRTLEAILLRSETYLKQVREERDKGNSPEHSHNCRGDSSQPLLWCCNARGPCWVCYCTERQGWHGFVAQTKILSVHQPIWAPLATSKLWTCLEAAKTVAVSSPPSRILDSLLPTFGTFFLALVFASLQSSFQNLLTFIFRKKPCYSTSGCCRDRLRAAQQPAQAPPWWHWPPMVNSSFLQWAP